MKKSRRSFLAAVASGGAGMSLAALDPVAAATPKPPTSQSVALATAMQARFDPALTADDVRTIAQAIDANNVAAQALNPKKKRLKNGDAPVVRFIVPGGEE
jgi:ABC-type transport system substrate-binding protein